MRISLEKWQMIGIVLSIVWFVGFAAKGWNDSIGGIRKNFTNGLIECYHDQSTRPSDADWAQFKQCLDREKALFETEFEAHEKAIPILLGIDLLTIAVAWLVAWTIVGLARWATRRRSI